MPIIEYIGVVLFNFSDTDFAVNMGDRIAQIVFEKIKTPEIKEVKSLEGTERDDDGFGSTGVHTMQQMNEMKTTRTNEDAKSTNEEQTGQTMPGEVMKKSSQLS